MFALIHIKVDYAFRLFADDTCAFEPARTGKTSAEPSIEQPTNHSATTDSPSHYTSALYSSMAEVAGGAGGEAKTCPHRVGRIVGPYFLTVYNLITTIILMNVLGAMFLYVVSLRSFTVAVVQYTLLTTVYSSSNVVRVQQNV